VSSSLSWLAIGTADAGFDEERFGLSVHHQICCQKNVSDAHLAHAGFELYDSRNEYGHEALLKRHLYFRYGEQPCQLRGLSGMVDISVSFWKTMRSYRHRAFVVAVLHENSSRRKRICEDLSPTA
jgi:hypothetical protein